jgi:hypothetical protein
MAAPALLAPPEGTEQDLGLHYISCVPHQPKATFIVIIFVVNLFVHTV